MTRIFTFGYGQHDPRTGRGLDDRFVRVEGDTDQHLRAKMLDRFGAGNGLGNWAFDYESEDAAGVARYGLIEIDFQTGLDIETTTHRHPRRRSGRE